MGSVLSFFQVNLKTAYGSRKQMILDKEIHGGGHNSHYRCKSTRAESNQVERANVSEGARDTLWFLLHVKCSTSFSLLKEPLKRLWVLFHKTLLVWHWHVLYQRTMIQYMPWDTNTTKHWCLTSITSGPSVQPQNYLKHFHETFTYSNLYEIACNEDLK